MDNETRQVVYRLVSTVLGSLALLASLLAIHAHRWLAADAPGAFVAGVTDAAVVATVRVGAAAAFLLCLAGLVVVGRRYYALCAEPAREIKRSAVSGVAVALVGVGTLALAPDAAFESLGLTFLLVGTVFFVGGAGRLLAPVENAPR